MKLEYDYYEKIYTESDIIDMFGADVLEKLHSENCEFDGNDWDASITVNALVRDNTKNAVHEETKIILSAIYKEPKGLACAEDLGTLDWVIKHYRLS